MKTENKQVLNWSIDGWWNFEYSVKEMVLTDYQNIYVTEVPYDKIEDTLFMLELLYSNYGSISGDYNSLKKFFDENCDFYEVY